MVSWISKIDMKSSTALKLRHLKGRGMSMILNNQFQKYEKLEFRENGLDAHKNFFWVNTYSMNNMNKFHFI